MKTGFKYKFLENNFLRLESKKQKWDDQTTIQRYLKKKVLKFQNPWFTKLVKKKKKKNKNYVNIYKWLNETNFFFVVIILFLLITWQPLPYPSLSNLILSWVFVYAE